MQERTQPPSVDNLTEARRAIEAMLLVANDPTPVQLLAQLVELPVDLVQSMCLELAGEYEAQRRGFQLAEVAGGWRFQTHPDTHAYVERFALEGVPNRLSSAALETLAIVAYKQPISRAQVGAIRGVNVDGVLRTLVQRGYVDEQGRDDGPGQATLFGTTPFFLEQLGLMSLDDLPPLGDFVPSVEVLEALENTLRVDPEPEIVIVDDDAEAVEGSGEATVEAAPDGADPAPGEASEEHPDADVPPVSDAAIETEPDVDQEAVADDAEVGTAQDAAAADEGAEPEIDVATDADGEGPSTPIQPVPVIGQLAGNGSNGSVSGAANGSTNGSSNGSSDGAIVTTETEPDDDAVFEVIGDPAASVIPLSVAPSDWTAEAGPPADDLDEPPETTEPTEASEDPVDASFPSEPAETRPTREEVAPEEPIPVDGDLVEAPEFADLALIPVPVPEAEPAPPHENDAENHCGPTDEDDPVEAAETEEHLEGDRLEPVPTDELEVMADPEVDTTDGPTGTGAAGADDARFPGPRSAPPPEPANGTDPGQGPDAGLGQEPAGEVQQHRSSSPPPASWPETLSNGHRVDPESGDA